MENIVLIGFMGVGKGTLARKLAREIDYFAIDTDDLIESFENRKIKQIFQEEGEPYFRRLEAKVAAWLGSNVNHCIISTGGGFLMVPNLKELGTVIYLKASFKTIKEKIVNHPNAAKKIKKRPLFRDLDKAKKLLRSREADYENLADHVVCVDARNTAAITAEIRTLLKADGLV